MISTPKVSIVIPVHKNVCISQRCVDSILSQTLQEIEIILVNAESTGNHFTELKDKRVVLLQCNRGSFGAAVNMGITHARGEYVTIVQASDCIEKEMCSAMYERACRHQADIVKCHYRLAENEHETDTIVHDAFGRLQIDKLIDETRFFEWNRETFSNWWGTLYRTRFMINHRIQFSDTDWFFRDEDDCLSWRLIAKLKRLYITRMCYYTHETRVPVSAEVENYRKALAYIDCQRQYWSWCSKDNRLKRYYLEHNFKALYVGILYRANELCKGLQKVRFFEYAAPLMRECAAEFGFALFSNAERKDYKLITRHPLWRSIKGFFFDKYYSPEYSFVRVLGWRIFIERTSNNQCVRTIMGIPYKSSLEAPEENTPYYTKEEEYQLLEIGAAAAAISDLHQKTFPKYKGCHKGEDVVLIATGPTINDAPKIGAVKCLGVNRAITMNQFKLDYCFMGDYMAVREYIEKTYTYDCVSFFGMSTSPNPWSNGIPVEIMEKSQAERYYYVHEIGPRVGRILYHDISHFPLFSAGSITINALHFLIYTQPRRIYLVGCDTCNNGYYDKNVTQSPGNYDMIFHGYLKLKEMCNIFYPNVEIVSVNPVGLKGVFREVYTSSYLTKHPELDTESEEVLDEIG